MSIVRESEIQERLEGVRFRVRTAAARVGRDPETVRIVAITKSHPHEVVVAAYEAGLRQIGENRVEEALPKKATVSEYVDLAWHMVGHVQSRKAKSVVQVFDAVHSVDRMKIAEKLNRLAGEGGRRLPVYLECNVSGEASKWGWPLSDRTEWTSAAEQFATIAEMPNLKLRGLMTMAPMVTDPERVRPIFRKLRELQEYLQGALLVDLPHLSMGMSDDFEVAVEEGATVLRIGRALFGPRANG